MTEGWEYELRTQTRVNMSNYRFDFRPMEDAVVDILKTNPPVQSLCLDWNDIGDDFICKLAHALLYNDTLKILNLSNNNISSVGVQYLLDALKQNVTLRVLVLRYNRVNDASCKAIDQFLTTNMSITGFPIHGNYPVWPFELKMIIRRIDAKTKQTQTIHVMIRREIVFPFLATYKRRPLWKDVCVLIAKRMWQARVDPRWKQLAPK